MTAPETSTAGPETIGQRLRRLRTERRLSQRELSSPGVSYAYISRIEAGTRQPSVKALRMLAKKLGVSADYLETGSDLNPEETRELRLADAELLLIFDEKVEEAEEAFAEVLDEATANGDLPSAMRARIGLGLAAARRDDSARAEEYLQRAVADGVSPRDRPDVFGALGRAYLDLGRNDRAIGLHEGALRDVREQAPEDLTSQARIAAYLADALSEAGDFDGLEDVLESVLEATAITADEIARVRLYWSLARIAQFEGEGRMAISYLRRATVLVAALEDAAELARMYLLSARIAGARGDTEDSGRYLALAERLLGANPAPIDHARLRVEQGRLALLTKNASEAKGRARDALHLLAVGDGTEQDEGEAHWVLAEAFALDEELEYGGDEFERAVSMLSSSGRLREASQAAVGWGRMLRSAGRESEALNVMERATSLAVGDRT